LRILINCSNLRVGGGLQVAHSFLNEIRENIDYQFLIVMSESLAQQIDVTLFSKNFQFKYYSIQPSAIKAILGKDNYLDKLEINFKADIVFSVFGPTYWRPKAKHICGFAKPSYIYKESPFFKMLSKKEFVKLKLMEFFHMFDFKNNNNLLITENKNVSIILSKRINKKVLTVTNFYNQVFNNQMIWDDKVKFEEDLDFFKLLTISANYPHKNLSIIKSVIPILKSKYPDFKFKFYLSLTHADFGIQKNDILNENICFFGKVSINQCPSLYQQCDFLFLPTVLECFSASYCEAMVMEKPILTSDLSFARGICEDAAFYFNPMDAADIAEKIYELSNDKILQNLLRKRGIVQLEKFDTSNTRAKKYLKIIKEEYENSK